jgi:hypothetical protein
MLSQPSTSAVINQNETGVAPTNFSASGVVLPSTDLIRATGGAGGIVLTLTRAVYPTNNPAGPTFLGQAYYAIRVDAGIEVGNGLVQIVDPGGALFNGYPSWDLENRWQWAIFMWNGTTWDVIGD